LFDHEQRWLGEVIEDDGFVLRSLMHRATACAVPRPDMLAAIVPPPLPAFPVRCFALGEAPERVAVTPALRAHDRPPEPSDQPPHEPPPPPPMRDPDVPEHPNPVREPPGNKPPVSAAHAA
jgi:hypothetical protein